ncbi:hypothetical protein [Porphyromonas sp.]|uniref:hypothetical protein n=1 Tax=Porphyromonas sp. TaxID=1924944 RepID=UPI0026DB0AC6|nr:hypothetical protein [Porphyromonas sp.]MDO4770450.1 hypothetical protein [Porphyromonas sp.]
MKVKICGLLAMILILGMSCTQSNKKSSQGGTSNLSEYGLFGQVKSVHTVAYAVSSEDGQDSKMSYYDGVRSFDEVGKILSDERNGDDDIRTISYVYDDFGRLQREELTYVDERVEVRQYVYDVSGNLIEMSVVTGDSIVSQRDTHVFDSNNHLIETETYRIEGGRDKITRAYDAKGLLIEERVSLSDGSESRVSFSYNDKDSLVGSLTYNADGLLASELIVSRNIEGKRVGSETKVYDHSGGLEYRYLETLDEKGNPILSETYSPDGEISARTQRSYDDMGRLTETVYFSMSEDDTLVISLHSKYKYDKMGGLIEESTSFPIEGHLYVASMEYEYDKEGNWTRMTTVHLNDGEQDPTRIVTERQLKYYK